METNIDIVKQLYAAFAKKDIPAILTILSDDVEWSEPKNPYNPPSGMHKGHAGFLEWLHIGKDAEDILILEPISFLTNNKSVAVIGHMKCLAKRTGKTYESDFVHYIVINDNKICKFQEFFDTYIAGEAYR